MARATAARMNVDQKPFCKRLLSLTGAKNTREVWSDFITAFALAIANSVDKRHFESREKQYMRIMKKYNGRERMVFPELVADVVMAFENNPEQDFLGSMYMELNMGNDRAGQFFTPYDVCRLMAKVGGNQMALEVMEKGIATMHDCACGAGATLIAGCHEAKKQLSILGLNWQNHVLVVAQDIDYLVGMMCYIQLSLIGAAGYVKIGNSLTDPITEHDDTKNYWYTPMYFSKVWTYRRIFHNIDRLFQPAKSEGEKLHDADETQKERTA